AERTGRRHRRPQRPRLHRGCTTPVAQAVAIKDDRIVWVGDEMDAEAHAGPTTKVIDAAGRMLLPGFIDSHFHVLLGGNPNVLRIENGNTLAEIQRQVHEFAMKRPELKWIEVEGWNYSAFPHGMLPSAKDLAGLTGRRPAFLVAYDYHTIWMNREALREFGITRATRKVIFAEHVEKDPKTAEPTGHPNRIRQHGTFPRCGGGATQAPAVAYARGDCA